MDQLKSSVTSPPIVQYPDFEKLLIHTTDENNEAIGAVLSQGKPGKDLPIYFARRALSATEKRYSTIEKEFLAIVWAVKNFRTYLIGKHFKIFTDQKPLKGIAYLKDQHKRLGRFRLKLLEYDFEVLYKPGKNNLIADALSRLPAFKSKISVVTRSQSKAQEEAIDPIMETDYENEYSSGNGDTAVVLTDPQEIKKVLRIFHDTPIGVHKGFMKTYLRIRKQFRWKSMQRQIKN